MSNISKDTATAIALAYREVETAKELLKKVIEGVDRYGAIPDVRDAFGRHQGGLQLGVPMGKDGHSLYNVPWNLCRPIIEAHITAQETLISVLTEKARIEMQSTAED